VLFYLGLRWGPCDGAGVVLFLIYLFVKICVYLWTISAVIHVSDYLRVANYCDAILSEHVGEADCPGSARRISPMFVELSHVYDVWKPVG
jgi:hypothetical protein